MLLFLLVILGFHNPNMAALSPKNVMEPSSRDGSILLDHGTTLIGNFHIQKNGDFFRIKEQKFSARLSTADHQNPPLSDFYSSFHDYGEDATKAHGEGKDLRYILKIMNDLEHGISFSYTRDQRIIIQDIYQGGLVYGTIIYLGHGQFKKYVGEIKNRTFDGIGALEFIDGKKLLGRFNHGSLNGPYLESSQKVLVQFIKDKLISTTPMKAERCHDPYLGTFYLNQGTCKDEEVRAHSANFQDGRLVYHGSFKKGKLWQGEIIPMALNIPGTFGKFENGTPIGVVRIQKKNELTLGTLRDGKLQGQIAIHNFKTGEKFVGQYQDGKRNGPFRLLNYNYEIIQKGNYKNDRLDGEISIYDKQAHLKSIENYQNGKKVTKKKVKKIP